MTKILADTNLLVYALDKKDKKHNIVEQTLNQYVNEKQIAVSIQNLVELSRILTKKISPAFDEDTVRQHLFEFEKTTHIIFYNAHTVAEALHIQKEYKIHFFDALLAATMQENGITKILTENKKDFKKIPWLEVINPFE